MDVTIKQKVLQKLMHEPGLSFNQLWNKDGESNKFSYHLNQLIETNIIEKKALKYYLTQEGKELVIFLDGSSGKKKKQALVNIVMVVYDNNDNILLYQRLKEPFYGVYGFPGAKLDFGEHVLSCAARELKEETNLTCDLKEVGLMNLITYEDDKLAYQHVQYIIKCTNPKGELKEIDREGTFEWATKEEFLSKEQFPDNLYTIKYIEEGKYFRVDMNRYIDDGKFSKIEILNEEFYS